MIELTKRRRSVAESMRPSVKFIQEDFHHWTPAGPYDVVVTHFFLDCFDEKELEEIVRKIAATLSTGGIWLLADFTTSQSAASGKFTLGYWFRSCTRSFVSPRVFRQGD